MVEDRQFPLYRKYSNGQRYYKILNPLTFIEIQRIGSRILKTEHHAEIYPDKLFISDLIGLTQPGIETSSESEFNELM